MDIHSRFFENSDCEALIKDLVRPWCGLLPPWLHSLNIDSSTNPTDDSVVANTQVMPEYGLATIEIYPLFWDTPPKKQQAHLLHEILHVAHGRVLSLVQRRLLTHLKEANPELHAFCEDEFRERSEEFVENLTQALLAYNGAGAEHP